MIIQSQYSSKVQESNVQRRRCCRRILEQSRNVMTSGEGTHHPAIDISAVESVK